MLKTSHLLSITLGTQLLLLQGYTTERNGCWSLSPDVLVTMAEMTYSIYFLHIYLSSILSSFSLCMGPICISSFAFFLVLCLSVCPIYKPVLLIASWISRVFCRVSFAHFCR